MSEAPPAPSAPPPDGPPMPRRYAEPVASWVALGALIGFVGPTSAAIAFGLPLLQYSPFIVGSALVGVLGGAVLGFLDPPGRLLPPGLPLGSTLLRGALAIVATALLGVGWSALAGAAGGGALTASVLLLAGGSPVLAPLGIVSLGAVLGIGVGTPVVALFGLARVVGVARGVPGIASAIAVVLLPLFGAGLSRLVFAVVFHPAAF